MSGPTDADRRSGMSPDDREGPPHAPNPSILAALRRRRPRRPRRPAGLRPDDRRRHQRSGPRSATINVRTAPKTSATVKRVITKGAVVTAIGTVTGGSWSRRLRRPPSSGSAWLKIVAINGKSTTVAVRPERGLRREGPVQVRSEPDRDAEADAAHAHADADHRPRRPPTAPTTTNYIANCAVRLRTIGVDLGRHEGDHRHQHGRHRRGKVDRRLLGGRLQDQRLRQQLVQDHRRRRQERLVPLRRERRLRGDRPVPASPRPPATGGHRRLALAGRDRLGQGQGAPARRSRSPRRPRASASRTTGTTATRPARWARASSSARTTSPGPGTTRSGGRLVRRTTPATSTACSSRRSTSSGPAASARPRSRAG